MSILETKLVYRISEKLLYLEKKKYFLYNITKEIETIQIIRILKVELLNKKQFQPQKRI